VILPVVGPARVLQADGVQDLISTRPGKLLASVLVVGLLVGFTVGIRAIGPRLKQRLESEDVEAIQAVLFTAVAAAVSWVLVVIWRAVDEVQTGLSFAKVGPREGVLALVGLLTLVTAYALTRVIKGLLDHRGGDVITAHRREALHHVIQLVIYSAALVFILSLAGVNPGNLIVGAGAIGLIVGLAARQTLGSILAGIVLLFARPFELGDWVVIDDREGTVTDVTLFNTELRTYEDEHVMIPNDQVAASEIVNRSRSGRLRVSVEVGIDYDADVGRAAEIAERAMVECDDETILDNPSPLVVGKEFGDSAVVLDCRFWIANPAARRMYHAQDTIIQVIKDTFEREGIKIPYPQRELMARQGQTDVQVTGNGRSSRAPGESPARATGDGRATDAESGGDEAGR